MNVVLTAHTSIGCFAFIDVVILLFAISDFEDFVLIILNYVRLT